MATAVDGAGRLSSDDKVVLIGSVAVAAVMLLLYVWKRYNNTKDGRRLPPSPGGSLPILGHLHLLARDQLPHRALHKLAKKHGPLMYLRLGSAPTIVASSPAMAREVLKTHDLTFASRPWTAAGEHIFYGCTDVLTSPYGSYWRQVRQICVLELFGPKRMNEFRPVRVEETAALVRSVLDQAGGPAELRPKLFSMLCNVIFRMTVGMSAREMATVVPGVDFSEMIMYDLSKLLGTFNIGDVLPYLQPLDLQGCIREMKALSKKSDAVLQGIVDRRRAEDRLIPPGPGADVEPNNFRRRTDLLDLLLSLQSSSSDDDGKITDNNVKAVLYDMFGAGVDTSTITVEWGMAELLKKPAEMDKLRAEIDSVVGNERMVEEADLPKLPFLQAVVKETMRLHPGGPLMFPHLSSQACEIAGFHIPAKTRLLVNVWAINRDEHSWDRPDAFCPGRFVGSTLDVKGHHFQLLPFGSGRRGCPGMPLAITVVSIVLATLVHAFDWSLKDPNQDMSELFGVTTCMASPLVAIATPRLADRLYPRA